MSAPKTNILKAVINITKNPISELIQHYSRYSNRANNMGDALEMYIKDLFCGTLNETDLARKEEEYSSYFSYIGNQNNPPDIIIRGGEAIEVKKIQSPGSSLALNSSYPKDCLYADSPMITSACRDCESWTKKDIIYSVGVVNDSRLSSLWMVYGDCYAANKETYERIKTKISEGVREINGVDFAETNELGRVNKVDPLGITYLRIRGMWGIENPMRVFDYLQQVQQNNGFIVAALMLRNKYESFPVDDKNAVVELERLGKILFEEVKIKDPNNLANRKDAVLITFTSPINQS